MSSLYFIADDGSHGYELWKSNGSSTNTEMVKDIYSGATSANIQASIIANVDGVLYFSADDGVRGQELWKSDGTSAGTGIASDLTNGSGASSPLYVTNLNGQLFFRATVNSASELFSLDTRSRDLYYSSRWQVLEERIDDETVVQHVWSPVYVDAMVLRDRDLDGDGSADDERLYPLHDANFNVTSLVDDDGAVVERFLYDPYGAVTVREANWSPDIYDGYSDVSWNYLHQGGRYDSGTRMYHFRHREYDPTLGRWVQQDPAGYVDGATLYNYVGNAPVVLRDPFGLSPWSEFWASAERVLSKAKEWLKNLSMVFSGAEGCDCKERVSNEVEYENRRFKGRLKWDGRYHQGYAEVAQTLQVSFMGIDQENEIAMNVPQVQNSAGLRWGFDLNINLSGNHTGTISYDYRTNRRSVIRRGIFTAHPRGFTIGAHNVIAGNEYGKKCALAVAASADVETWFGPMRTIVPAEVLDYDRPCACISVETMLSDSAKALHFSPEDAMAIMKSISW